MQNGHKCTECDQSFNTAMQLRMHFGHKHLNNDQISGSGEQWMEKETPYWKYPKVKAYQQEYNKMYYLANKKKLIADQTKRNKSNKTYLQHYMKNYYQSNRGRLLKYAKKRRKQMNRYFIKAHHVGLLERRQNNHCVNCGKEFSMGDEITTTRTKQRLRPRCIECSEKVHLI